MSMAQQHSSLDTSKGILTQKSRIVKQLAGSVVNPRPVWLESGVRVRSLAMVDQ